MTRIIDVMDVQKGDVVRFNSYALRVESEPERTSNSVVLRGRISTDGCPLVKKRFIKGLSVRIERNEAREFTLTTEQAREMGLLEDIEQPARVVTVQPLQLKPENGEQS